MFFVIDEVFVPFLQPLEGKVRKYIFPVSMLNIETNSFNTIIQLINPNYASENRIKRI